MKRLVVLLFICAGLTTAASAQTLPAILKKISYSHMVDTLLLRRMEHRMTNQDEGYRVLIFSQSGNHSQSAAIEAKAQFDMAYPQCKSYLLFEEPYFKVKVGNFTNRIEAGFFLKSIKADYPLAFVVKDALDVEACLEL